MRSFGISSTPDVHSIYFILYILYLSFNWRTVRNPSLGINIVFIEILQEAANLLQYLLKNGVSTRNKKRVCDYVLILYSPNLFWKLCILLYNVKCTPVKKNNSSFCSSSLFFIFLSSSYNNVSVPTLYNYIEFN